MEFEEYGVFGGNKVLIFGIQQVQKESELEGELKSIEVLPGARCAPTLDEIEGLKKYSNYGALVKKMKWYLEMDPHEIKENLNPIGPTINRP